MLEMSRSHLHWSLRPAERGKGWGGLMCWLPLHFIPHSFSLWYFLTYARSILSLSLSLSHLSRTPPYILFCLPFLHYNPLSLPISGCLPFHSRCPSLAVFLLSFCLFLFRQHSLRIPFNLLFTHSFHVFTLAPSPSLPVSLTVCQC